MRPVWEGPAPRKEPSNPVRDVGKVTVEAAISATWVYSLVFATLEE